LKFRSVDGISKSNPANRAIRRVIGFIARQKHNYRVAITRAAANNFLLNLTAQYDSIYTVGLGADSVELGSISSIGNGIGAILSSPIGWLMDRYGLKRLYLLGMALMAGSAMVYALASSWEAIIVAMVLFSVSTRFIGTGCSVICADSVRNKDRVTAQNICVTIASLLAMLSPLVAARLVTLYGGLNVEGIRPLYTIRFVGYLLVLFFLTAQLKDLQPASETNIDSKSGFVGDFKQLFVGKGPLKRWLLVASLTWFPMAMTTPFLQLFAHQTKGADQYLLSIMATATVLTQVLFGIPLGRLADKIGRKKAFTLILAGALQTFYFIASGVTNAMTLELVPVNRMGRWSGLIGLFRGLVTIPAPILGGLIWDNLNPMYVFLLPIGVDFLLKLPLLATIPETLSVAPDEK
jgi:MFS family permease